MNEGDIIVFECGEDKCTFLFRRILSGGFIDSVIGSNSYYLEHGKFIQQHFDKDYCRPATNEEKIAYRVLQHNSQFK